ncbi:hypothetical protein [Mesorhizobium sp. GR13]|uniref:hypothetical protein n=1 Tax=Mesorhizobium sp. GR13 TaxID=2562308 RepID=UPI0010C07F69|nr:hypothetical protein [Mesorhizobium sp. GR13]
MSRLKLTTSRYARRLDMDGTWTVFDAFTGRAAEVGSRQTTGTQMRDAGERVAILNRIHPAEGASTLH